MTREHVAPWHGISISRVIIRGIYVQLLFNRFLSNEVVIVDARRVEKQYGKTQCGPIPPPRHAFSSSSDPPPIPIVEKKHQYLDTAVVQTGNPRSPS